MGFATSLFGIDGTEEKIYGTVKKTGPASLEMISDTFQKQYPQLSEETKERIQFTRWLNDINRSFIN